MKFSVSSIGIMLVTLLWVTACVGKKNDSLPASQTEVVLVHEEEVEVEEPPPPPPFIDLSVFNIFVFDDQSVFYYNDPAFRIKGEAGKYQLDNLKEELIHKSSYKDLMNVLGKLVKDNALAEKRVIMVVRDSDSKEVKRMAEEMLHSLGLKEVSVSPMTVKLESLLKKKQ